MVIAPAPGIGVDDAVRSHREVAGMAQLVRENGSAKAWRQRDAPIIPGAGARSRRRRLVGGLSVGRCSCRQ